MRNPELALWRAVLARAVADATDDSTAPEKARARDEARRWLLAEPNPDRELVCALADVDAAAVVDRALRLKVRRWRVDEATRRALTGAAEDGLRPGAKSIEGRGGPKKNKIAPERNCFW
jgi:hypothetical protein